MQYAKPVTLNVEECDRLSFLPYLFGNDFLYAEAYVYALAQKMMPEYQGGFWHFIRLPDGGGYMMPDGDRFHMVNGANWFDRTVSADAAGIILTSLVINRQLWLYHDSGDAGLTQLYRMRDAFQLCGLSVVCGLCRASILAGLALMQGYASPLRSPGPSFPSAVIFRSFTRSDFAVSPSNSRQPCASGCGFPCAPASPPYRPAFLEARHRPVSRNM